MMLHLNTQNLPLMSSIKIQRGLEFHEKKNPGFREISIFANTANTEKAAGAALASSM